MNDNYFSVKAGSQWHPFPNPPLPVEGQTPAVVPLVDIAKLPNVARFVVVGAGVHGLSTAFHLAMALEQSGKGKGSDVVLIDKQGPGAGASGISCGCAGNFYMTEPLLHIMKESIKVWESDPIHLGFQQVGQVIVGESGQEEDYVRIHQNQLDIGYPSAVRKSIFSGSRNCPS